jgi:hypothetical protein
MVLHPAQRGDLVAQAKIGRHTRDRQKSFDTEPVIDGDPQDTVACKSPAVAYRDVLATRPRNRRRG